MNSQKKTMSKHYADKGGTIRKTDRREGGGSMEGERGGREVKHPSVGIRDRTSLANVPPTLFVSVGSHTPAEKEERKY